MPEPIDIQPYLNQMRPTPLHGGGGGGTSNGMDIVDAKIAAAEARTDTKFAELRGDLKAISASTSGTKSTVIGTGIAVAAIVVAVMGFGSQMFGTGMNVQSVADQTAAAYEQRTEVRLESQAEQMVRLDRQLQLILERLAANSTQP